MTHFRQEIANQLRLYMVFTIRKGIENDYSIVINPRPASVTDVDIRIVESDTDD